MQVCCDLPQSDCPRLPTFTRMSFDNPQGTSANLLHVIG